MSHEVERLMRVYEGACAYCAQHRIERLSILSNDGRPVASLEDRGPYYRIGDPLPGGTTPAANLALLEVYRSLAGRKRP